MDKKQFNLLIVDDEEFNVELLNDILSDEYNIKVAFNGKQALAVLDKFTKIDLILLDISMAEMDGLECAKIIKQNPNTQDIPFIFLTAHTEAEMIKKAFEIGAKDYINKPINIDELFARIKAHLQNSFLQKDILRQKEKYETIFNYAGDGIATIDLRGDFQTANKAFLEITKYSLDEIRQKNCNDLTVKEFQEKNDLAIQVAIEKGHVDNFETECIVKDNIRIVVNMSITLLPDKQSLLIVAKNTTHLKLIEEQTRLVAMGEMIGNIAHQWRQPLSVISTLISGLQIKSEIDEKFTKKDIEILSENILRQTQYLSNTIDHFRDFVKGNNKFQYIKLSKVIQNTLDLVEATIQNNFITLVLQINDDLEIFANKDQLSEAFINIVNNAKDILKEVENNTDNRYLLITTKKVDDKSIKIYFQDSAQGIDLKIVSRIFEPYFTTKHQYIGTGLGLSMADKIIREKHHGKITAYNKDFTIDNKQLHGACFEITLYSK